jgi:2-dehydro-3-deoxyphosphogluconate aldolase/(4S)-4-hydroxy-2-oxoglutarate aldolase
MPTGGVDCTQESLNAWFEAGIVCAGIGSKMITKELLKEKNYEGITQSVALTLERIKKVRNKS